MSTRQDIVISAETNIIYFSHGGGPLPLLGDKSHLAMIKFLQNLSLKIAKPEAIIVISAHWEESQITILGKNSPPLLYDYYGFPEEAYSIKYPIKGNLELVNELQSVFNNKKISSRVELKRGYDHGVFIPLKIMYPDAEIPVIQLSLIKGLDPLEHILLGRSLKELKTKNLLIIGSGFSFHNVGAFSFNKNNEQDKKNDDFQEWLIKKCTANTSNDQIADDLVSWESAPYARYCHPREEHLLPLHVCFGVSKEPATLIFDDYIAGKRSIALHWENQ
jgi:aromatic ring-opening dioxygenase catalytic subunit (LigB family)